MHQLNSSFLRNLCWPWSMSSQVELMKIYPPDEIRLLEFNSADEEVEKG